MVLQANALRDEVLAISRDNIKGHACLNVIARLVYEITIKSDTMLLSKYAQE